MISCRRQSQISIFAANFSNYEKSTIYFHSFTLDGRNYAGSRQ